MGELVNLLVKRVSRPESALSAGIVSTQLELEKGDFSKNCGKHDLDTRLRGKDLFFQYLLRVSHAREGGYPVRFFSDEVSSYQEYSVDEAVRLVHGLEPSERMEIVTETSGAELP